jgi:ssDNA-binding Zn-finger/Zn-ribbon topoisomerase 1
MALRSSRYGLFYGCTAYPKCKAAHGAHPNGAPLGIPANKETKLARMRAHEAFDSFWKRKCWKRHEGYRWMREVMGMSRRDAHIARFGIDECERLIGLVEKEGGHV